MKSKTLYILIIIIIIFVTLILSQVNLDSKGARIHQHLDERWQSTDVKSSNGFQTNLPIIKIDTEGQKIPGKPIAGIDGPAGFELTENGDSEITGYFSAIDLQKGSNALSDDPTLESLARIAYRGNSSRYFDKLSFSVNLILKDGNENRKELLGMSAHDQWVLNGPILDRSLLRNYLSYNISGEIMDYAPNVRYCELFLDGEYQGIYLLMENISKGPERININKPENKKDATDYIIKLDREGKADKPLDNYGMYTYKLDGSAFDVLYPSRLELTEGQRKYIEKDVSKIEKKIYSYDLLYDTKSYKKDIDVDAFAEYFVLNEFFGNVDAGLHSTYYYRTIKGKIKPVVWDFNNAFDNYIDYDHNQAGFTMIERPIFDALIKDEKFVDLIVSKYRDLRDKELNEKYLLNYIDETQLWLGDSVNRNYEKWGYVFDLTNYDGMKYLTPVDRNVTSYQQAVNQLKQYIISRGNWMDDNIEVLYQYSHESKNVNDLMK